MQKHLDLFVVYDLLLLCVLNELDRLTVTLTSKNPRRDLEFWKHMWDIFAEKMPDRGFSATPPIELGSYATFIERQNTIRNGKKTCLGNGLEFDGTTVKRTESKE